MEKLNLIIASIILAAVVIVVFFVSVPRIDRLLKIMSVQVCSSANVYREQVSNAVTVQYPMQDLYEKCISDTK